MANKARGLSAQAQHRRLIKKLISLLEEGKLINEKDLNIDRQKFNSVFMALKKQSDLDILTIKRGHKTVGWILASEVL